MIHSLRHRRSWNRCLTATSRVAARIADVLDDGEITRILAITAHPDDVDFGAAGTIARWTEAGIEVTYCVVTDGDAGSRRGTATYPEEPLACHIHANLA